MHGKPKRKMLMISDKLIKPEDSKTEIIMSANAQKSEKKDAVDQR